MSRYTSHLARAFWTRREKRLKTLHRIRSASEACTSVHIGRFIVIETESDSPDAAKAPVTTMCERLLANPVTEDFEIESAVPA